MHITIRGRNDGGKNNVEINPLILNSNFDEIVQERA